MKYFRRRPDFILTLSLALVLSFLAGSCSAAPVQEHPVGTGTPTEIPAVASPLPPTTSETPPPVTATKLPPPTSSPVPAVIETLPPFQDLESAQLAYQTALAQNVDSEWGRMLVGIRVEEVWCRGLHELISTYEVADLYNDKAVEAEFQGANGLSQQGREAFTPADGTPDNIRAFYDRFLDLIDNVDAALREWELNESMVPSGARQTMAFHCSELENLEGEAFAEAAQNGAGISHEDLGQVGQIAAQLFEMMGAGEN